MRYLEVPCMGPGSGLAGHAPWIRGSQVIQSVSAESICHEHRSQRRASRDAPDRRAPVSEFRERHTVESGWVPVSLVAMAWHSVGTAAERLQLIAGYGQGLAISRTTRINILKAHGSCLCQLSVMCMHAHTSSGDQAPALHLNSNLKLASL